MLLILYRDIAGPAGKIPLLLFWESVQSPSKRHKIVLQGPTYTQILPAFLTVVGTSTLMGPAVSV